MREEEILEFWRKNKIFEKSLKKGGKEFVFYEGPPTANAAPGIHHLEARAFKDAIPRYKTMRGYHVRRKGGWDTHGLPVELQVEKKLGLNSKKAIEKYGVAKFNDECRKNVWEQVDNWSKFTERIGFWIDQEDPYITYENDYIESVWNIIAHVDKQKLLYKDYKVVPWCPRCGTVLSSHELAQGYEDVKDLSVTAKFKIIGFPNAYFLAWTTTPWTLPGNVALAVGKDIIYVEAKVGEEIFVLAKDRLSVLENYEIIAEHKGSEMIGMEYEPLYPFLKNKNPENIGNAYKVYAADFVSTEEGTGIVHTAVMYGQDDFELGTKVGLPKQHLVDPDGKFIDGTDWLSGRSVVDEVLAVDILKDLQKRNLVFAKESYTHSYPFCWRCKTRLIYYARDSWYIRMSEPKIKKKLISENKKINWEPAHIREGRFGEWLRDVKDWAISRERYWGTPLPVWMAEDGEKIVIDSLATLKKYSKSANNEYLLMRHGGAESNEKGFVSSDPNAKNPLTQKGEKQVINSAEKLKKHSIDFIIASPLERTRQSAEIVRKELKLSESAVVYDERLREIGFGNLEGRPIKEYWAAFSNPSNRFREAAPGGESLYDVKMRVGKFLKEIEKTYKNKKILIVAHEDSLWMLHSAAEGRNEREAMVLKSSSEDFFKNGEVKPVKLIPLPRNDDFELDLHRPYIDEIILEKNGKEFRRVKEVMDVWLDSGAMPFAQDHYPFDAKKILYPADYISEAIDQTRGWFYTLHAVGVLMGRGRAYENVICLGHLLDAQGKKMSKSVGNVVDPWEMIGKYGADTLRLWMYSVNQPGESKNFDEKTVHLLRQQVFTLLYNVLAFYELYRNKNLEKNEEPKSKNVLDQWILCRLNELINFTTESLDNYKLMEPTRTIRDFINDLSTWYLRRSRERIKEGDKDAKKTLYFVLKTLAKVMAPFAPFTAEDIWLKLRTEKDEESVHICEWPKTRKIHSNILKNMRITREVVTQGLEARQKAGIPVRQPLKELQVIKSVKLSSEYLELIKDELNVKEVTVGSEFKLSTEITTELKMEGEYREFMRELQDRRKKLGLNPGDKMPLKVMEIYKKYKIFPRLQEHMLRVAAVVTLICDNFSSPVDKNDLILAALFHDMGNIIKTDLTYFSDFDKEEIKYWENVKSEYVNKYGHDEHVPAIQIMKEIGLPEKAIYLATQDRFSLLCEHRDSSEMDVKIMSYSDNRVNPNGVVSYDERMEEARVRYQWKNRGMEEERQKFVACGAEIEKQIFAHCKIKPEDITDEAVAPIIEELKKLVI
ncbi:MAG: class I tRNA ligase family protein [Patescibacteria group bacterium]